MTCGQLFIVATPIGNLGDITYRAVETLKNVDVIAAEDTRNSKKLLHHYGIGTPMIAVHEHNESAMADALLARLQRGENIALISDAGTPLISDPGYRLVSRLLKAHMRITPVPGPSSVMAALCAAGMPTDHFRFAGFLPRSGAARSRALRHIAACDETTILLESPRRLLGALTDMQALFGETREIVVARELTKLYEEFVAGSPGSLVEHFKAHAPRGEIVVVIGPADAQASALTDENILNCLASESVRSLPPTARARAVAKSLDISRSRVYALMIADD